MANYRIVTQEQIDIQKYNDYLDSRNPIFIGDKLPLTISKTFKEMFGYEVIF